MHPYLVPGLDCGPLVIQRLVEAMPAARYDIPTGPGRFTPREVVAHLADWEPVLRARIVTALESPGSKVPVYDEGQMAIDHRYRESDIQAQARLFVEERKRTSGLVASLTADQMKLTVIHPERGELSVEDVAGMLLGHDLYHVEQLSAWIAGPNSP